MSGNEREEVNVPFIESMVDAGKEVKKIVVAAKTSKTYVQQIKQRRIAYHKIAEQVHRGPKPAISLILLRKLFDVVTSCRPASLSNLIHEPCNILTLDRFAKLINNDSAKQRSKLQISRYLKKIGLCHEHPFKLMQQNKLLMAWKNNEYVSICNKKEWDSEKLFLNSTYVTRSYLYYEVDSPKTYKDAGEIRKVLLLWAITPKGVWYLYVARGSYSTGQTLSFLKNLYSEIKKPLCLIVNKDHDSIYNDMTVLTYIRKQRGWSLYELPVPLV